MNLVIVESPTKARKLTHFLGKDYQVEASVGHVRDLPKKKLGIDETTFEPEYEVDDEKKAVVSKLLKLSRAAKIVYLATDPDREGEAIAWHIQTLLAPDKKNKDTKFFRSTFHEITSKAVLSAIEHPGSINMNLVDAQQARRILDRLVGYKVSPVLWRKVRRGLSAGRVQSVALRLIVEREREILAFKGEEYFEVDVLLNTKLTDKKNSGKFSITLAEKKIASETEVAEMEPVLKWLKNIPENHLVARLVELNQHKFAPKNQDEVKPLLTFLPDAKYQVLNIEQKSRSRSSLPPFTTSTLQQAATNRLGFTSKQTMRLAQQLYEEGLITYHRTDSVNLAESAITMARDYISQQFGPKYLPEQPRVFANKSKNAQEAHEAIRVTDVGLTAANLGQKMSSITDKHIKLYDLIWKRFLGSQMTAAQYDQTTVTIEAKDKQDQAILKSSGSILKFDGWIKLSGKNGDDVFLPEVKVGQDLGFTDLSAAQKFTQPPARYNDAALVKELEKRGIGRPSTYASIISVIEDRGYVERIDRRFKPTDIGMVVNDFLLKHFAQIMDYDFTAKMEDNLDEIANGKKVWQQILKDFYGPFKELVSEVSKDAERVAVPVEKTGEKCPLCHEGEVVIRTGRFGKFKSCSRFPDCKFTENIVEKLPGQKCPLCQEGDVVVKKTRWGKPFYGCSRYPKCTWADWYKPKPDYRISAEEWAAKQAARAAKAKERIKNQPKTETKSRKSKASPRPKADQPSADKPRTKSKKD